MLNQTPILLRGLILLRILLLPQSAIADVTYYVTAGDESSPECPDGLEPCHNIDYYINNETIFFSSDKMNVTMKLYGGTHTINTEGAFDVFGLNRLLIIGLSSDVVLKSITISPPSTWSIKGNEFCANNIVVVGINFSFRVHSLQISSVIFQGNSKVLIEPSLQKNRIAYCKSDTGTTLNSAADVILTKCEFREQSFVETREIGNFTLRDCKFLNISIPSVNSPITTYGSMIYLSGTSKFTHSDRSSILAYDSDITLSGNITFKNNTAINGGAIALHSSTLYIDKNANVSFINNRAISVGGAIFVDSGALTILSYSYFPHLPCFYQILHPFESNYSFELTFTNNSAGLGGNDIYGTPLKGNCQESRNSPFYFDAYKQFRFNTNSLSPVSGSPSRVCVCENDIPQCTDPLRIFMNRSVYPEERITIPVVVVGGDFGTTVGNVYHGFLNQTSWASQLVSNNTKCTNVTVDLCSMKRDVHAVLYLSTIPYGIIGNQQLKSYFFNKDDIYKSVEKYERNGKISFALLTTPVFVKVSFLQCPPGLYLTGLYCSINNYYCYQCDCHPKVCCSSQIENGNARIGIDGGWIGIDSEANTLLSSQLCPFDYCTTSFSQESYYVMCYDSRYLE